MIAFYHIALFLHISGVVALFIASGFELASLARLRSASTLEQTREAGWLAMLHAKIILIAVLTVFFAGLYLVIAAWNFTTAWIDVSLAIFLSHSVVAQVLNAPRGKAIHAALMKAPAGPLSPSLRSRLSDPVLHASNEIIFAQILGIVFLMTVKPGLVVTLLSVVVATLIGLIPTLLRRRQAKTAAAASAVPVEDSVLSASGN